jgi:uncharacterized membrane protein
MFCFLSKNNYLGFYVFLALSLLIKEDIALLMIPIAFFVYFYKRNILHAVSIICISAIWYWAARQIMIGSGNSVDYTHYYSGLFAKDAYGLVGILKTVITNPFFILKNGLIPEKIIYYFQMFVPFAFLPFFSRRNWWLFLYGLAVVFLAPKTYPSLYQISLQYVWYLVPALFIGSVFTLRRIRSCEMGAMARSKFNDNRDVRMKESRISFLRRKEVLSFGSFLVIVIFLSFILSWQYGAFFNRELFKGGFRSIDFNFTKADKDRLRAFYEITAALPAGSSVSASENICPHLNKISRVETFRFFNKDTDYVLLFDPDHDNPSKYNELLSTNRYTIMLRKPGFQLLRQNKDPE